MPEAEVGKLSPELHAAIRRAHGLREIALELREIAEDSVEASPQLEGATRDPERFGELARALLDLPIDRQFAWQDPGKALTGWIDALSALDVLVLQVQKIPLDEMRGFSLSANPMPVVTLNGSDFPRGRIFTLLHEFNHVLLNAEGVCDLLPRRAVRNAADEVEVFCNRAAAAALMPADVFMAEPSLQPPPADGRWDEDVIDARSPFATP